MNFTKEHFEILDHTIHRAAGRLYCGDSPEMRELVAAGYMESVGRVSFCPDEYFKITQAGVSAWAFTKAGMNAFDRFGAHGVVPIGITIDKKV